jgi:hypothetical protein
VLATDETSQIAGEVLSSVGDVVERPHARDRAGRQHELANPIARTYKSLATHISLIIAVLIATLSSSSPQTSGSETPMGDTWPSREEFIYIPRTAIAPSGVKVFRNVLDS